MKKEEEEVTERTRAKERELNHFEVGRLCHISFNQVSISQYVLPTSDTTTLLLP